MLMNVDQGFSIILFYLPGMYEVVYNPTDQQTRNMHGVKGVGGGSGVDVTILLTHNKSYAHYNVAQLKRPQSR